jgi:hypothetical protein
MRVLPHCPPCCWLQEGFAGIGVARRDFYHLVHFGVNAMAQTIMVPSEQLAIVAAAQTPYITGKIHLCGTAVALTSATTLAELVAAEATFTGYAEVTLTTLPAPYPDGVNGGYSFNLPTVNFAVGASPTVTNDIYGGWWETSVPALLVAFQMLDAWPMQFAGQALNLDWIINFFGTTPNLQLISINGIPQ